MPYLTARRAPSPDSSRAQRLRVPSVRDGAEWAGGGAAARPRPAPPRPAPTEATGRRCGPAHGGGEGLTGDPRGREGTGGGRGAGSRGTGRESGPWKTGPLPALGLLLRVDACPPPCLLPAPRPFPRDLRRLLRGLGRLGLPTHSPLGGAALGGRRVLPPGVPSPCPPCSGPAGWGLLPHAGTRSSVTH